MAQLTSKRVKSNENIEEDNGPSKFAKYLKGTETSGSDSDSDSLDHELSTAIKDKPIATPSPMMVRIKKRISEKTTEEQAIQEEKERASILRTLRICHMFLKVFSR